MPNRDNWDLLRVNAQQSGETHYSLGWLTMWRLRTYYTLHTCVTCSSSKVRGGTTLRQGKGKALSWCARECYEHDNGVPWHTWDGPPPKRGGTGRPWQNLIPNGVGVC